MDQPTRAPDLVEIVDEMDELTPLNPPKTALFHASVLYPQAPAGERPPTENTLYEPGRKRAESSPSPSNSSFSEFDVSKSGTANAHHRIASGLDLRQRPVLSADQDNRAISISSTAQDEYSIPSVKSGRSGSRSLTNLQPTEVADGNIGFGIAERKTRIVEEAVADARRQLLTVRQREQSSRPLKVVSQDPQRAPDPALSALFQKSANDELQIRRLNARDWLRVATWWLLKVLSLFFTPQTVSQCTNEAGQE